MLKNLDLLHPYVLFAALGMTGCGLDSAPGPGGSNPPDPTAMMPPGPGPGPGSITVMVGGLQAGYTVTTARLRGMDTPEEATARSDGSPVELTGTPDDMFFATVADSHGNPVDAYMMGSRCSLAPPHQLAVPADFPTIQAAVDAAQSGETVKVAPGTYTEFVKLRPGVCLLGSGAGQTILDARGAHQSLLDLTSAPGSAVVGFTLRGVSQQPSGCADPQDPFRCSGDWYTAALYMEGMDWRDPVQDAPPLIALNVFEGNDIGLLLYWRSAAFIRSNIFINNRLGLIANHFQSRALIANNVFWQNQDMAIGNQAAYLDIINNIIAGSAVGILFEYIQTGWIRCNLFYADTKIQDDVYIVPPRFNLGMDGNVEVDPGFVDPGNRDFHLKPGSPAIDHGCFVGTAFEPDDSPEDIGAYGGPLGSWHIP